MCLCCRVERIDLVNLAPGFPHRVDCGRQGHGSGKEHFATQGQEGHQRQWEWISITLGQGEGRNGKQRWKQRRAGVAITVALCLGQG